MLQALSSTMRRHANRNLFSVDTRLQFVNSSLLMIGNLAFVVAVYAAHSSPATGYEVNVFASTPTLYWVGLGVAFVSALWVLTFARERVPWLGGFGLTTLAGISVPALPLLRGYYFYGLSDPLFHLGWAKQLQQGTMTFFDLLYPGTHTFSAILSTLGGAPAERSMLLAAFVMTCSFVAFSVLAVRTILPNRTALGIALVSSLLFLPINHVGFEPTAKTYSMATFFFPFAMYLVVKHLTSEGPDPTLPHRLSATDLAFLVGGVTIIFYHPQVAANVIVFTGSIAVTQFVARRKFPDTHLARSKPVYGQLAVLTLLFFAWNVQHTALFDLTGRLLESLSGLFLGSEQAGEIVQDRANSADQAGTGIVTLFVRIFLLQAVYVAAGAGVVLARVFGALQFEDRRVAIVVDAFAVAGVVSAVFFLSHFVGSVSAYFFRHVGFGMAFGPILAVVGFYRLVSSTSDFTSGVRRTLKTVGVVLMAVALAMSIAAFFSSPYVSLPTSHVSEQQFTGHATAFERSADGAAFAAPRTGPQRYYDARGIHMDNRLQWDVTAAQMRSGLREVRRNDFPIKDFYYLFVTETDRKRELVAYNGLRYGSEAFESVPDQEGVSRIHSNGEVDVYQVLYSEPEDDGPGE